MRKTFLLLFIILFYMSFVEKAYAHILFQDNFNDVDGLPLTKHNNLWQNNFFPDYAIILNNEVKSSNNSNIIYYIPSLVNLTDYCVQADFIYPLPHTSPPDFFDIETRQKPDHSYNFGVTADNNLFFNHDGNALFQETITLANGMHQARLCSVGKNHSLYIDNNLITTIIDNTNLSGAPGFELGNSTPIDNFIVTSASQPSLSVPLLKQTSEPWQGQEYDSAHIWDPSDLTINRWGCALTSATMILQYYGYYTIPGTNFEPLNPGTLNNWLKSQPDGYVGTGWVNWLAISRLSKLATDINSVVGFDALEYNRISGADKTQLTDDINSNIPDILEESGHFIVAKGIDGNTFDINDPYYNFTSLDNTRYNNSFLSLGRFVPAKTDLSYIMLTADSNVTLSVKDSQGHDVGSSFVQAPLIDPVDNSQTNSPIRIYYLPKPDSGTYTITGTVTSGPFKFTSYLYDTNGNPKIQNENGFNSATFTISFDKLNNANSEITKNVTYQSAIQDIITSQKQHLINTGFSVALIGLLENADKLSKKHPENAKIFLKTGLKLLEGSKNNPHIIFSEAYGILTNDFQTLLNAL